MPKQLHAINKHLHQNERIMLVSVMLTEAFSGNNEIREQAFAASTAEAVELIHATGGEWICTETAKRDRPHTALFVGTGKAEELAQLVKKNQIDLVIFNHNLTPTQERNLEQILHCRVLDRVGLILAIFAQRAQTQEGKLQVELAQLSHLSGRLIRGYTHLSGQKGGIGLKGPGETQLETDRRLIQNKINQLKKQLRTVQRQRETQRQARHRSGLKTFAIVGYTNAGKSSLFNRLSKANVFSENQLFATLDTTARKLYLNQENSIILTDTVGFIRDLPHKLVSAFSATLEETALADVLIHLVDVSNPEYLRQIDDVNAVLKEIGADCIPQLLVYNKQDLLPTKHQFIGIQRHANHQIIAVGISVQKDLGLNDLRTALIELAQSSHQAA